MTIIDITETKHYAKYIDIIRQINAIEAGKIKNTNIFKEISIRIEELPAELKCIAKAQVMQCAKKIFGNSYQNGHALFNAGVKDGLGEEFAKIGHKIMEDKKTDFHEIKVLEIYTHRFSESCAR